jgi:hypothetical protein
LREWVKYLTEGIGLNVKCLIEGMVKYLIEGIGLNVKYLIEGMG